jgi:hypothetical protein
MIVLIDKPPVRTVRVFDMKRMKVTGYLIIATVGAVLMSGALLGDQSNSSSTSNVRIVNLELADVPVKDAIEKLFAGTGLKYNIGPGVSGRVVELKLKGVTFEQALNALMEAARLTYKLEDGVYIISPADAKTSTSNNQGESATKQDTSKPQEQLPSEQTPTDKTETTEPNAQQRSPTGQATVTGPIIISNEQSSPVFYGHPLPPYYPPYGIDGYPPVYQFGAVRILGGYPPVVVAGGNPYIIRHGPLPPPPIGYVSPEVLRFLRTQWAIQNRTYITPY